MTEPTKQQIALVAFADSCEAPGGIKTSAYWRLTPQIDEARAAIWKHNKEKEHADKGQTGR